MVNECCLCGNFLLSVEPFNDKIRHQFGFRSSLMWSSISTTDNRIFFFHMIKQNFRAQRKWNSLCIRTNANVQNANSQTHLGHIAFVSSAKSVWNFSVRPSNQFSDSLFGVPNHAHSNCANSCPSCWSARRPVIHLTIYLFGRPICRRFDDQHDSQPSVCNDSRRSETTNRRSRLWTHTHTLKRQDY